MARAAEALEEFVDEFERYTDFVDETTGEIHATLVNLRETTFAGELGAKFEDLVRADTQQRLASLHEERGRTSHIAQLFLSLGDDNRWNDARYAAFQLKFEEKTTRAAEFADRIERYAEWLRRLADDVEERWGETMNVS